MPTLLNDAVQEARVLLQDMQLPYRYSDDQLAGYVYEALTVFRRNRPDFTVGTTAPDRANYTAALLTTTALPAPFDVDFLSAVVDYVLARAMMRDDQLLDDGRAAAIMQKASAALLSPGM